MSLVDDLTQFAWSYVSPSATATSTPAPPVTGRGPRRRSWSKLGVRGVYQQPTGRYQAQLCIAGKRVHLGMYDTVEQAAAAVARYEEAQGDGPFPG